MPTVNATVLDPAGTVSVAGAVATTGLNVVVVARLKVVSIGAGRSSVTTPWTGVPPTTSVTLRVRPVIASDAAGSAAGGGGGGGAGTFFACAVPAKSMNAASAIGASSRSDLVRTQRDACVAMDVLLLRWRSPPSSVPCWTCSRIES